MHPNKEQVYGLVRPNLQMVSHILNATEDFVMFFDFQVACFIDGFTSGMKSQLIASLLSGSAHSMGFMDKWPSRTQR